jgi:hypothetical protein
VQPLLDFRLRIFVPRLREIGFGRVRVDVCPRVAEDNS